MVQDNYGGTVAEQDDCAPNVAFVRPVSPTGPLATFTVTGQSTIGTCRAVFTAGGSKRAGLAILIVPPGFSIDLSTHSDAKE